MHRDQKKEPLFST